VKSAIDLKLQQIESGNGFMPNFDVKEVERLVSSISKSAEPKLVRAKSKSKKVKSKKSTTKKVEQFLSND
jgi:hypothetical protein